MAKLCLQYVCCGMIRDGYLRIIACRHMQEVILCWERLGVTLVAETMENDDMGVPADSRKKTRGKPKHIGDVPP